MYSRSRSWSMWSYAVLTIVENSPQNDIDALLLSSMIMTTIITTSFAYGDFSNPFPHVHYEAKDHPQSPLLSDPSFACPDIMTCYPSLIRFDLRWLLFLSLSIIVRGLNVSFLAATGTFVLALACAITLPFGTGIIRGIIANCHQMLAPNTQ